MALFDEIQWQATVGRDVGFTTTGGPQRQTQVVVMGSNAEARNARWTNSRRSWQIVAGKISLNTGMKAVNFFEARNAQLIGWRLQDPLDWLSCPPGDYNTPGIPKFDDQVIAIGDGVTRTFPLMKTYGDSARSYVRRIFKPQTGTVLLGINGSKQTAGSYTVDYTRGLVTVTGSAPLYGWLITAGYKFDYGVRFNTDKLDFDFTDPSACVIQNMPVIQLPDSELAAE
jgi:uncharacterized protein (TIGR02217 family)